MAEVGRLTDTDGTKIMVVTYGDHVCLEADEACIANLDGPGLARMRELLDIADSWMPPR